MANGSSPPQWERCVRILVCLGFFILGSLCPQFATAQVFVSPQDANALRLSGASILDARRQRSYLRSHAPGAVRIDWQTFSDPDQRGRLHSDDLYLVDRFRALGVSTNRPVVIMGDWQRGWGEEGRIFWMFEYLGHEKVHIVSGGCSGWIDAGMPVTQDAVSPALGEFTILRNPSRLLTLDEVIEGDYALLDVRTRGEYAGETPYGSSRGGHVPGAVHLDWRTLFSTVGELLPRSALEQLLPEGPTATYCTGGVRSGFVYAVMRALGRHDVANYAGSWWEYADSAHPTAP